MSKTLRYSEHFHHSSFKRWMESYVHCNTSKRFLLTSHGVCIDFAVDLDNRGNEETLHLTLAQKD